MEKAQPELARHVFARTRRNFPLRKRTLVEGMGPQSDDC